MSSHRPLLSPHCRSLTYDRSGMGRSEPSPAPRSPTLNTIASDLHALLEATNIQPPYFLLAHSWSGKIATYFASTFPSAQTTISGLILLDAGAPTQSAPLGQHKDFTTDPGSPWSQPCVFPMVQGLDLLPLTAPPDCCALTAGEYEYLRTPTSTLLTPTPASRPYTTLAWQPATEQPLKERGFSICLRPGGRMCCRIKSSF
jgi:pimeloyl-ACP methyl ester carboxylesterase